MGDDVFYASTKDSISASEYENFHKQSCIRNNFTSMYYTLGLVEEASEVLENVRTNAADADVIKECGDVLWYATGLVRNQNFSLNLFTGLSFTEESLEQTIVSDGEPEVTLVLNAGALAGRLKKFERGDYGEDELREYVRQTIPKILCALHAICVSKGRGLVDAAECNKKKIEKRLTKGMLKGDGSNREDASLQTDVSSVVCPVNTGRS